MEGQKLFFLSSGYDLLESYTEKLYGERGTFHHNLLRYRYSDEFRYACRSPQNLSDIPEVSFEQILAQIELDDYFDEFSRHVVTTYDTRMQEGQMTDMDCIHCAGALGLCPGPGDDDDVLFPHLVDLTQSSDEEDQALIDSVLRQQNIVSVMVNTMLSGMRDHQIINLHGHDVYSLGYARNYYRGENAYYGESRPSLFRSLPTDPTERMIHLVLGETRMIEFSLWLMQLNFVKQWPYGDVFHGAIAQHYGIPTNGMDVTSDLKTALFFACCKYENGKWRPLNESEFAEANSRDLGLGRDSRYGILYCAPVDVANMSKQANIPELHFTYATPIGYQPFMRCAGQKGYMIEAGEPYDMYRDASFQMVKFRHTKEICDWIFHKMKEGEAIYPHDSFGSCDDIVDTIRKSTLIQEEAFSYALRRLNHTDKEENIREILTARGFQFKSEIAWCTPQRLKELDDNWFKHADQNPQVQATPKYQIGFCIGANPT